MSEVAAALLHPWFLHLPYRLRIVVPVVYRVPDLPGTGNARNDVVLPQAVHVPDAELLPDAAPAAAHVGRLVDDALVHVDDGLADGELLREQRRRVLALLLGLWGR